MSLSAQVRMKSPWVNAPKHPVKVQADKKSLYFKVGLSNLIHPATPSLDLGVELAIRRTSLELMYGLKTPKLYGEEFEENRWPFDSYHKLFASLRYYDTDRIYSAAQVPLVYFGGEVYYSWGKDVRKNDFAIDEDFARIDYTSANIEREVLGLTLKGGIILPLSNRLELELVAGVGYLYVNRFYTFFGVQPPIQNINFSDGFVTAYNDRALGKHHLPNLIINGKFNVRIF